MWTHKKYGKRNYKGSYDFKSGEREFKLVGKDSKGKIHIISFESWQAAKALGWTYDPHA